MNVYSPAGAGKVHIQTGAVTGLATRLQRVEEELAGTYDYASLGYDLLGWGLADRHAKAAWCTGGAVDYAVKNLYARVASTGYANHTITEYMMQCASAYKGQEAEFAKRIGWIREGNRPIKEDLGDLIPKRVWHGVIPEPKWNGKDFDYHPLPAEPPTWEDDGWSLLKAGGPWYAQTAERLFHDLGGSSLPYAAELTRNAAAKVRGLSDAYAAALKELATIWPDGQDADLTRRVLEKSRSNLYRISDIGKRLAGELDFLGANAERWREELRGLVYPLGIRWFAGAGDEVRQYMGGMTEELHVSYNRIRGQWAELAAVPILRFGREDDDNGWDPYGSD
ncbi:hypothetical protein Sru01_30530 [Sphaerisporangium rufum]|uniref:Uncharacterized protein n=1 Tax=Sphaerisporangium rufum TaxID=1381558 RepID=A0A919UYI0_9ACTN|nr:hypothetical protein [Sphaerisporangium rufum]GII78071.1 hypothetical protein Sru01_30530 [Sphaerisporangium rufum]